MSNAGAKCHWPALPQQSDMALRQAVDYILDRFDVDGIVAAGTILRGRPHASSDLDIYVIQPHPFRQRIQRFFHGVPAEIFVNPPQMIRRYFAEEHAAGSPITAHMLATGWVVFARDPVVDQLRSEAMNWMSRPSQPTEARLVWDRYMAATLYEDALDVVDHDSATAVFLLDQAVVRMLHYWFRSRGRFLPRNKELLATLAALDADLGKTARAYFGVPPEERLALAKAVADHCIGVHGFFEWESDPEVVEA